MTAASPLLEALALFEEGAIAADADGRVAFTNRAAEDLLELPAAALAGRDLADVIGVDSGELARAMRADSGWERDCVLRSADGRCSRVRWKVGRLANLEPLALLAVVRIVDPPSESPARFLEAIIEHSPHSIWVSDRRGTMLRMNQACRDLLQATDTELVGKYNVLHDNVVEAQGRMPLVRHAFEKGRPVQFEIVYDSGQLQRSRPRVAVVRHLAVTISPVLDDAGEVVNAVIQHVDLTDRVCAEAALRARTEELEALLRRMANAFVTWGTVFDGSGRLVDIRFDYFNEAYSRVSGLRLEDVQGKTVREVWPETEESWFEAYAEVARTGKPRSFEMYHAPTHGLYACNAYRPSEGSEQVCCVFEDITQRRNEQRALERTNRQLRMLSDSNQTLIRATDETTLLRDVCRIIVETGGYRLAWIGLAVADDAKRVWPVAQAGFDDDYLESIRVTWADEPLGRGPIGTAIRTDETVIIRDVTRDPRFMPWREQALLRGFQSVLAAPLHEGGRTIGALGIYAAEPDAFDERETALLEELGDDLSFGMSVLRARTVHARAEREMRASEDRFRRLFESAADALLVHDENGRILDVNRAACESLGYTRDQLKSLTVPEIEVGHSRESCVECWREVRGGGHVDREGIHRRADGSTFPVDLRLRSFQQGDEMLVFVMARDISQRKWAEAEHARLEEGLRQAQKMESIGRLAGGIAHDFNNLLTAIGINAELALLDVPPSHPGHGRLAEIDKAVESAAKLTRQLLAFSRKQLIEPKIASVNAVVSDLQKMLHRLLGEDIELESMLAEPIGNVRIDTGQTEQVLVNLAVNARDAMPNGGKLTIETANVTIDDAYCRQHPDAMPGEYVVLSVSDNGSGMSAEVRQRIFEPFFTTKSQGRGTGLGLAMVYGAMRQNKGWIQVYSEVGQGTTFRLYFPRADGAVEPERAVATTDLVGGHESILLAEDDDSVREVAVKILLQLGYHVDAHASGEQALASALATSRPIDLLITDVVMPGMTGRTLAERVAAAHPETQTLFTSGYTDNVIAHHGVLDAGIEFVSKPFRVETLARRVREILDRRK